MYGSAGGDNNRSFAIVTERLLVYTKDSQNYNANVAEVRDYIRAEIKKAKGKIVLKEVNEV